MCRRINEECRTSTRVLVSSILVLYSLCIALTAGETLTSPAIVRERRRARQSQAVQCSNALQLELML
jgi:hypothetical protein